MSVKMITTAAGPGGVLKSGQVYDLDAEQEEQLVAGRYAESVERAAPEPEAVDEEVETATKPESAENAATSTKRRTRNTPKKGRGA